MREFTKDPGGSKISEPGGSKIIIDPGTGLVVFDPGPGGGWRKEPGGLNK
ncbi:hypothetical protein [Bacillus sp. C1]